MVGGGGSRRAAARRGKRRPLPGRGVAAAVGDAAAPFPQQPEPALMGVAKDGELVVAENKEIEHQIPKGPGSDGVVDDLVGETGPAKPEDERGRIVALHADNKDGGVLVR